MLKAHEIEVGVVGQSITVRGSAPPRDDGRYGVGQEFCLALPLARELHRLLGALIPIAEQSEIGAPSPWPLHISNARAEPSDG